MSFVQVQQSLVSHRKTLRLARLLGIDRYAVCGRLVALWAWCLDNALGGCLGDIDAEILADVMGWDAGMGKPAELLEALLTSGFLEVNPSDGRMHIHDWHEHMGRLIEKREASAERMRRMRARNAADADEPSGDGERSQPAHDAADVTLRARYAHVTRQEKSREEKSNTTSESDLREREHVRGSDMAADAALALIAPAPQSSSSSPSSQSSSQPSAKPAKVTPITTGAGARVRDAVWDACIAAMGAAPSNDVERGKWAKGIKALKESLSPPCADGSPGPRITSEIAAEIGVRAQRYRARYGSSVPLNPMALAGNWTALASDIPTPQERQEVRYGQANGYAAYGRRDQGHGKPSKPKFGSQEYYAQSVPASAAGSSSPTATRAAHVG